MKRNQGSDFTATRWTMVHQAKAESPEGRLALGELCEAYWPPVYRFLCCQGRKEDEARELTQEFFRGLLATQGLAGADSAKGRFRSYLLGAVKHFLADQRRAADRLKRGGNAEVTSLSSQRDGVRPLEVADAARMPDDTVFDRQWAFTVLDRAIGGLRGEMEARGQALIFQRLKPWLTGGTPDGTQEAAARELGMSPGALKVSIHRLRGRFRRLVKEEIAHTVRGDADIDEELRYLLEVVSRSAGERP